MANEKDLWRELDKNLRDALGECKDLNGLFGACSAVLGSMCKIIGGRKDLDNKKPGVGVRGMKDILSGNGDKCNCGSKIKFLSKDGEPISDGVNEVNFGNFCECLEAISKLSRGGFLWIGSSALSKTTQRLCKDFEAKAGNLFKDFSKNKQDQQVQQNQGQAGDNKNAGGGGQNNGDANPVKNGNVQQPLQQPIPVPNQPILPNNQPIPVPDPNVNAPKGGVPNPPPMKLFDTAGTAKLKLYREKLGNDCDKILAKLKELYVNQERCSVPDTNNNKNIVIQVRAVINEKELGNLNKDFIADGHKVEYFGPVNIYAEEGAVGTGGDYYVASSNMKDVIDGVKLLDLFEKLKGEVKIKKLGEDDIKHKGVVKNGQGGNNKNNEGGMKGQLQDMFKNFADKKKSNQEKLKKLLEENKRLGGELWKDKKYGEPGKWEKVNEMDMLFDDILNLERDNKKLKPNNNKK